MNRTGYLAIAIAIIVVLAAIMIITHVAYRKMKVAKGYPDIHPQEEKCSGCGEIGCPFYAKFHQEEEK